MAKYALTTCSTADISPEYLEKREIGFLKFVYYVDGIEYKDDIGKSITFEQFYEKMRQGAETKTAQPSPEAIKDFLRPYLEEGKDVINLMLSSGLSGAMTSAKIATEELLLEFPERKIYFVDSLGASSGMGLLIDYMADLRDGGMEIDELYKWAEENKLRVHHWFCSTDLTYYVKGGRVSKVSGWFGTILNICPVLHVNEEGKLIPKQKVRGEKNALKRLVEKMEEFADSGCAYDGKCFISHSSLPDAANEVKRMIEEKFPSLKDKIVINSIGTTIGSHAGPGTVAVFFMGKNRLQ